MKTAVIWDLDGTLFDSYPVIVESIYLTFQESGIQLTRDEIKEHAIRSSSNALFYEVADERGIAAEALFDRYKQISRGKYDQIQPMPGAMEIIIFSFVTVPAIDSHQQKWICPETKSGSD